MGTLTESIKKYLLDAMEHAGDRLIELMRKEIFMTEDGGGPGKPGWRDKLADDIKIVFRDIVNDAIEFGVGADYSAGTWEHVRAMLIAYGGGSMGGGSRIMTHPGEEVWNDDLDGKKTSGAHNVYYLPDGFNQVGNDWLNNAMREMRLFFDDILNDAIRNMPESVLSKAVYVTQ